jgi:putative ABC transport system permease protein
VVATRASRAREMVLLKLVGATRGEVLASQGIEFALLALAVTASALATGTGAAWLLLAKSLGIDFQPGWWSLIGLALGAIAVTIGAALLAVLPALNARPATALRAL